MTQPTMLSKTMQPAQSIDLEAPVAQQPTQQAQPKQPTQPTQQAPVSEPVYFEEQATQVPHQPVQQRRNEPIQGSPADQVRQAQAAQQVAPPVQQSQPVAQTNNVPVVNSAVDMSNLGLQSLGDSAVVLDGQYDFAQYDGLGTDVESIDDIAIPPIVIVQDLNLKDIQEDNPHLQLEAGDFYNTIDEVATKSFDAIICGKQKFYAERDPKTGQKVADHPITTTLFEGLPENEVGRKVLPHNGNEISAAWRLYLLIYSEKNKGFTQARIDLKNSHVKTMQKFNGFITNNRVAMNTPNGPRPFKPPIFMYLVKFTSKHVENKDRQKWHQAEISDYRLITNQEIVAQAKLGFDNVNDGDFDIKDKSELPSYAPVKAAQQQRFGNPQNGYAPNSYPQQGYAQPQNPVNPPMPPQGQVYEQPPVQTYNDPRGEQL